MRIVFFGTPQFSANVLSYLLKNGINVVAVVSKPDKPKGRSGKLEPTPLKITALQQTPHLPVLQPEKISAPESSHLLPPYEADLFVVVAYGEILKQHILDIPKKGCINLHASLLPKFRGAAPIQRSIMAGETETGVTIMHMAKRMDAGNIIRMAKIPIGLEETFGQVAQKLCTLGSAELLHVLRDFEKGNVSEFSQDESQATYAPKIELGDCQINWESSAKDIHNLVRGVNPYPGAWCNVQTRSGIKSLKVWSTSVIEGMHGLPKQIQSCTETGLTVYCGQDALLIIECQLEGKRIMTPAELFRGASITLL